LRIWKEKNNYNKTIISTQNKIIVISSAKYHETQIA
jgi:hypothetical protein